MKMMSAGAVSLTGLVLACSGNVLVPGTALPHQVIGSNIVTASIGDITSVLVLEGTIVANPTIRVPNPVRGVVSDVLAKAGSEVEAGGKLFVVAPVAGAKVIQVDAPTAGMIATVNIVGGQPVEVGFDAIDLVPDGFEAVAALDPALLYRFPVTGPTNITVKIAGGPAPFSCRYLTLGLPTSGGGSAGTRPELRCEAASGVRLFTGLPCLVAVTLGGASSVVLIPTTAVVGLADTGIVTVVGSDGSHQQRTIQLGLTDGVSVQVVSGLQVGERILDPPPSVFSDPIVSAGSGLSGGSHGPPAGSSSP